MNNSQTTSARKGFTFYRSFAEAIDLLPNEDKLIVYEAITHYSLDGIEPNEEELSLCARLVWTAFKPNFEADRRRYENGTKGGCPKGTQKPSMEGNQNAKKESVEENKTETKPNQNQNQSNDNVNVNENDNVNVKVKENVKKEGGAVAPPQRSVTFTPPSIEEIRDYIVEKGYKDIDPQRFVDYYASIGWRVGNSPMCDWRAALRRWHSATSNQPTTNQPTSNLKKNNTNEPKLPSSNSGCAPRLFRNLGDDDYLDDAHSLRTETPAHNSRKG